MNIPLRENESVNVTLAASLANMSLASVLAMIGALPAFVTVEPAPVAAAAPAEAPVGAGNVVPFPSAVGAEPAAEIAETAVAVDEAPLAAEVLAEPEAEAAPETEPAEEEPAPAVEPGSCSVNAGELAKALAKVCRVVDKRNTIPILDCALLRKHDDGLEIVGTDLDRRIAVVIPAAIGEAFMIAVPAYQLRDMVRRFGADRTVELGAEATDGGPVLNVEIGGARSRMMAREAGDFPGGVSEASITATLEFDAETIAAAFRAVRFAISTEETRYYLNGVYFHTVRQGADGPLTLRMVATDGHRMACHDVEAGFHTEIAGTIIPRATVEAFMETIGAKPAKRRKGAAEPAPVRIMMEVRGQHGGVSFHAPGIVLDSKAIDGTFPDYQRVIPSAIGAAEMTVDAAQLVDLLHRLAAAVPGDGKAVKLAVGAEGVLTVSRSNPDTGKAEEGLDRHFIPGWTENKEGRSTVDSLEIGVNYRYLADILAHMPAKAKFAFIDPGSPMRVWAPGSPTLYVQMPMRV